MPFHQGILLATQAKAQIQKKKKKKKKPVQGKLL